MNESVPAAAPVTPPETGASTNVCLCVAAFTLSASATVGDIVLQSMMSDSGGALRKRPRSNQIYH